MHSSLSNIDNEKRIKVFLSDIINKIFKYIYIDNLNESEVSIIKFYQKLEDIFSTEINNSFISNFLKNELIHIVFKITRS